MTRLQYAVAAYVVLSAFHRLSDEAFLVRSFRPEDGGGGGAAPEAAAERSSLYFCPHCFYDQETPCIDRVQHLVRLYKLSEAEVQGSRIIRARCWKPFRADYEFCPHCTYSEDHLCLDKVRGVAAWDNTTEEAVKNRTDIVSRCKMPYFARGTHAGDEEPRLLFHAGPHKTGTTALQSFIYHLIYTHNDTVFLRDNLRVPSYDELPGVFAKEGVGLNLPHCALENYKISGGTMNIQMCDRMRRAFPKFLREAYDKGQNVLIVAEDFDQPDIDFARLEFFLQPYRRVNVVVSYRRLHDWLPSWYNQIISHYSQQYVQNETYYPSLVEWLAEHYDAFVQKHAIEVARRWRGFHLVESVDVLNLHQLPNSIEHFFCTHLHAVAVCRAIQDGARPSKVNVGGEHDYHRLALQAFLRGKININLHRPLNLNRATRRLKTYAEERGLNETLPRLCPAKELVERMLAREIEHESTFFREWYESQGGRGGLLRALEAAVKKKFCSFDVEKILKMDTLESFFDELRVCVNGRFQQGC